MLDSLRIAGFRAFNKVTIPKLGSVNLVVGRNNVGKTTLLEAIHLYTSRDALSAATNILDRRDEHALEGEVGDLNLEALFHRDGGGNQLISIGPVDEASSLVLRQEWTWHEDTEDGERILRRGEDPPVGVNADRVLSAINKHRGAEDIQSLSLEHRRRMFRRENNITSVLLPFSGFASSHVDVAELWDEIVLTDRETVVLDTLRLIEPELERIVMVGGPGRGARRGRRPLVRLKGLQPLPLRSQGDGMNRLFEVAVGLSKLGDGGTFLVDEVDSGLHFSTLVELWTMLFITSINHKVQIVATTHSWDCIQAFQEAAAQYPEAGMLVRLETTGAEVHAECFDQAELAIVTRQSIEVR